MNNNNITFLRTYPAVPFSRISLTTYPAVPLLILFSLTLLYHFPAFRIRLRIPNKCHFFFALLLCSYFSSHSPCCALFFCALTDYSLLRILLCLPCCALIFLRTYPAVRLSRFTISTYSYPAVPLFFIFSPCCTLIFLRTYPAAPFLSLPAANT